MKILLLSDIPPCQSFPTGLPVDQLCRFVPHGSIACFVLADPSVEARPTPDLDSIPIVCSPNRVERGYRPVRGIGSLPLAWVAESIRRHLLVPRLAARAIAFGRQQRPDLVWALLRGQTLIQIAPLVARKIGVPLVTQILADPAVSLAEREIDRFNRRATLSDFGHAVSTSTVCVTSSDTMSDTYRGRYGTPCVAVHTGHPSGWGKSPNLDNFPEATIEIGVAAVWDAAEQWVQLLRALNMSGWQVRGRSVRVNVIGERVAPGQAPPGRIRHFGWRSLAETVEIFSTFDILYHAAEFSIGLGKEMGLSFPRSFPLYLAAGRPILFHGPDGGAVPSYLRANAAGLVVPDDHAAAIYNAICKLVDDPAEYRRLGTAATAAFLRGFTVEKARDSFERALNLAMPVGRS